MGKSKLTDLVAEVGSLRAEIRRGFEQQDRRLAALETRLAAIEARPPADARPDAESRPAADARPAAESRPAADARPAAESRPAAEAGQPPPAAAAQPPPDAARERVREQLRIPNARKLDSELAEFYVLRDFLDPHECERLTNLIRSNLRPSTLVEPDVDANFRTSRSCDLGPLEDPLAIDVDRRMCSLLGMNPSYSESMQGQYYDVGQEFKAHTDYFEGVHGEAEMEVGGQRTWTFMVYLNDVEGGGETEFPRLRATVRPGRGSAVIWNNLRPDGRPNYNTLHHAHPVRAGFKCIITKWFRSLGGGPMFVDEPRNVANYTRVGFRKGALDGRLFERVQAFYREALHVPRSSDAGGGLIELPDELRTEVRESLRGHLETWSGVGLSPASVEGVRVHRAGAVQDLHVDREKTHVISAILSVEQDVDEEWPLVIEDNHCRRHHVFLQPGEALFYESGRLRHGRPRPLQGRRFASLVCHFRPAAGEEKREALLIQPVRRTG